MRALSRIGTALVLLALTTLVAVPPTTSDDGGWLELKLAAVDFEITDLEGQTLRAADLAGKVVVVDFWATWCGPCVKELPELAEFHERHRDSEDVMFLSAAVTEDAETVSAFAKKKQIPYPVFLADDLLGPYEVYVFPTKLIIDARDGSPGIVRFRREGYTPVSAVEEKLAQLRGR